MSKEEAVSLLRKRVVQRGAQAALAKELGVSQAYISDVLAGHRNPGPTILKSLGLTKVVRYEKEKG